MYSIVLLAAMSASPETPDFCCKKGGGYSQAYAGCYGGWGGQGWGYGGGGCCFCGKGGYGGGGYGYGGGGGGCCLCNILSCFCCCGKGGYGGGYGGGGCCILSCLHCGKAGYGYGGGQGGWGYGAPDGTFYALNAPQTSEAVVIVHIPADAKLFANGQETDLTGTERIFHTPALTPGQDYNYVMTIEHKSNGETKTAKKQITVRAGHRTTVDFTERAKSAVTVSLPANSKLTVDGIDTRMTGGKHTFMTPELSKGQPVSYEFRAEFEREGKMQVLTQKVSFKAGEPVELNFVEAAERTVSK